MLTEQHLAEFGNILDQTPADKLPVYLDAIRNWTSQHMLDDDFCPYTLWGEMMYDCGPYTAFRRAYKAFNLNPMSHDLTPLEDVFWDHWLDETSPRSDIQQLLDYAAERSAKEQASL